MKAFIIDVGCGAGFDSLIAQMKLGPMGRVIGNAWTGVH